MENLNLQWKIYIVKWKSILYKGKFTLNNEKLTMNNGKPTVVFGKSHTMVLHGRRQACPRVREAIFKKKAV